jgi:ankyrin repeat protein
MGSCECGSSKSEIKDSKPIQPQNSIKNENENLALFSIKPKSPKISLEKYDIDPYSVLNISQSSDDTAIKDAFKNLVTSPNRTIKSKACLAYEILFNKKNFVQYGNLYKIKVKDCFYFAIIGDLNSLKSLLKNNKNLLYSKDYLQRSLLYLAARNGYFDVTEYLLKKGIDINEVQSTGSTALHGAAFYGHELIVQLLIEHGIYTKKKNKNGLTAADDAKTPFIKNLILKSEQDIILNLYYNLNWKGFVSNLVPIKNGSKIIAQKMICLPGFLKKDYLYLNNNWIPAWHGTKLKVLESIADYGLRPAGTKLENGMPIQVNSGHIPLEQCFYGIDKWAKAVFVSPSIFYSTHFEYLERINTCGKTWCVLVEVRIRPGSYTKHPPTSIHNRLIGEPNDLEYRINMDNDSKYIDYAPLPKNIYITSITFVLLDFLENIKNYNEGNIIINSKEEKMLLED